MTGMKTNRFQVGQVVISRKGKDVGTWYVVIGWNAEEQRVLLCGGKRSRTEKPKKKNPVHLQRVNEILDEVPESLSEEHKLDGERVQQLLLEVKTKRYQNKEVD